jgi:hypothetical protein
MHDLGAPQSSPSAPLPRESSHPPEKRRSKIARWFDSWMRTLGMAFVLFLIIRTFFL